jgi:hypothetical protein
MKPTVWRDAVRDSDLDATAKLVAYTLSTFMNGAGTCWPSKGLLAVRCGRSVRTVDRAIERLEAAGFLVVGRTRGRTSNRYEAVLPNPVTHDGVGAGSNPVTGVAQPRHQCRSTPSPMTGESEQKASEDVSTLADARERAARAGRKTAAGARKRAAVEEITDPDLLAYDQ